MNLEDFRTEIDSCDQQLVEILAKRFSLMPELARYKKQHNLPIEHPEREAVLIKNNVQRFKGHGIDDPEFVEKLFILIMEKSKQIQYES